MFYIMKLLLRLSGEHPSLPHAELESVLEGEGISYELEVEDRNVLVDADTEELDFIERPAYVMEASDIIGGRLLVFDVVEGADPSATAFASVPI